MKKKDYTKFSAAEPNKTVEPVVEESSEFRVVGVVECALLNVRSAPDLDADVVCKIPVATEVKIDPFDPAEDFYKVYLASGEEGYCMKKFIEVYE